MQFREIIGLSPNLPPCLGVTSHMLMDPHSSTTRSLASETPLSEYKFVVTVDENEIPNWFNHQRDGNLISFLIGPEFPTIALCVALEIPDSTCYCSYHVIISINGSVRTFENILIEEDMRTEHLFFSCRPQSSLQDLFGDLNLGDRNHVELFCETFTLDCSSSGEITPIIKRIGVYVECICPPPKNPSIFHDINRHLSLQSGLGFPIDAENGSDSGLAFDSSNVDGLDLGSSSVTHLECICPLSSTDLMQGDDDTEFAPLLSPFSTSNGSHTNLGLRRRRPFQWI